jgi:cytochrome c oxidase subunit 5b
MDATSPGWPAGVCRAYEPRFGTEDKPIEVPALLAERIIGVTDPEDDTLVIW